MDSGIVFFNGRFLNLAVMHLSKNCLSFFKIFTANCAAWLINLFGIKAIVTGNTISLPKQTWLINMECKAIFIMILYSSFIVAYLAKSIAKIIRLFIGVTVIFLTNILRLVLLAFLTEIKASYATYFHDYVWQVGFIIMVVAFWIIWIGVAGN